MWKTATTNSSWRCRGVGSNVVIDYWSFSARFRETERIARTDGADPSGLTDFYGLQALALRAMVESGESFARLRVSDLGDGARSSKRLGPALVEAWRVTGIEETIDVDKWGRTMNARKAHQIWIEQCEAAQTIKARFGLEAAFDYLVGEKLANFVSAASGHPDFARELPRFVSEVRRMFTPDED